MKLTDFKALTFDVYGTLIDWETGMIEGLQPLLARLKNKPCANEILQAHAYHESTQQLQTPGYRYQDLLPIVYRRLAEQWSVHCSWQECLDYGQTVKDWPAFPDSAEALNFLKQRFKLVVLSNIDNDSFSHSNAKLGVEFDAVYTAEDVGAYKPSDENFNYMLAKIGGIGIAKKDILHTAESMFHDHVPANKFGLASCHIYRRHDKTGFGATMTPVDMPDYQFRFNSMQAMAETVRAELAQQAPAL